MAVLDSNLAPAWTPDQYGALIDTVVAAKSVAFQAGTLVNTDAETTRFPRLTADPAVAWYPENTTIALTDPVTDEVIVVPRKVAGRTQISNEAAADTTPAVAEAVGQSIARSIAKGVDKAFFANTTVNGPSGLLSLTGINVVDTGATITNLDAFHEAKFAALADGANISVWVLAPDLALALSKAKQLTTGGNVGLLDATGVTDGVTIAGVPVLVSTDVAAGNAWGLDKSQIYVVQRAGTTIVKSTEAAFAEDAVQVRGTSRVGFGFVNPAGVVRLYDSA